MFLSEVLRGGGGIQSTKEDFLDWVTIVYDIVMVDTWHYVFVRIHGTLLHIQKMNINRKNFKIYLGGQRTQGWNSDCDKSNNIIGLLKNLT